jgi:hypothetical protein
MLDHPFSSEAHKDFKSSNVNNYHDVITSITELQGQSRSTDHELSKLENSMEALEKSVSEIRDMARDAKHISIGVDGRNGLRGTLDHLSKDVGKLTEDMHLVKEAANNYNSNKAFLYKLIATSFVTVIIQFGGVVWYVSANHSQQQALRNDVNRIISYVDKQIDQNSPRSLLK